MINWHEASSLWRLIFIWLFIQTLVIKILDFSPFSFPYLLSDWQKFAITSNSEIIQLNLRTEKKIEYLYRKCILKGVINLRFNQNISKYHFSYKEYLFPQMSSFIYYRRFCSFIMAIHYLYFLNSRMSLKIKI